MSGNVLDQLNVSRETREKLEAYAALLVKWNKTINLISKATVDDIWIRHIVDSAQILLHAPSKVGYWLDLGSGGGLPGLVVAAIGFDQDRLQHLTLVEADQRKCAFLREAARQMSVPVSVLNERIETIADQKADVISARALANLSDLLSYSVRHSHAQTTMLMMKGANHEAEVEIARVKWNFRCAAYQSLTQPGAAILSVTGLSGKVQDKAE